MKTLLLLFVPFFCFAQTESKINNYAIINDKDGFTFVREKPDKNSKIVDTIFTNEVFQCGKLERDWYEVNNGYMHKSRVKAISTMDLKEQKALIEYCFTKQIDNLKAYQKELDLFENGKSTAKKIEEKREIRRTLLNQYSDFVALFEKYYLQTTDEATLKLCFNMVYADKGTKDGAQSALAECFKQKNNEVTNTLKTYSGEQLEYLLQYIECGLYYYFMNQVTIEEENKFGSIDAATAPKMKPYEDLIKKKFKRIKIKEQAPCIGY